MAYEHWEHWFIRLSQRAALMHCDINERDISVWQEHFENGLSNKEALSCEFEGAIEAPNSDLS